MSASEKKPSIWQRLFSRSKNVSGRSITERKGHTISRNDISDNALKVLYRLKSCGYKAFLVGGGVRDLLLGKAPKDYDVVTDAHPEALRDTFRNSRVIGRRFRLVHVYFQSEIIEVSTFRANIEETFDENQSVEEHESLPILGRTDNTYGTIEEDAWRRDFTVNALYYNIEDFSIVDYTGGMYDLKKCLIRMIGDPHQRFHEDPVRLLRAIRLAAKLDFSIEAKTKASLLKLSHLLQHVPKARLFDELLKLFFEGSAEAVYKKLKQLDYFKTLFPHVDPVINRKFFDLALKSTDERFHEGKTLNPAFLLAVFLWPLLQSTLYRKTSSKGRFFQQLHQAMQKTFLLQTENLMIPRRFINTIRSIWLLQYHLERQRKKRIYRVMEQRYFRAGFDFLKLRAEAGEPVQALVDWWQQIQTAPPKQKQKMINKLRD